ncbi:hypothetical protein H2203_005169 [Taxawa tesnikishii (nom. ined.)]|nr:hypothetical protein H2203_005169 [Dothideales sp. JES 119]
MSEVITRLQAHADGDLTALQHAFLDALHQIYPHADCSIQSASEDAVQMEGRRPLPFSEFQDGLWEDTEAIDEAIRLHNHEDFVWTKPIRAVASRCSMIMWNILQEHSLKEALQAKERFLRGITHQLRTPIHGVLGSVDLLTEELSAGHLLEATASEENGAHAHNTSAVLAMIRNSGRELMSTVNNMIKLNRWADMSGNPKPVTLQDFARMESDVLAEVVQLLPEEELDGVTVVFDNQLDDNIDVCVVDLVLLKECLQSLVLNAIQFAPQGFVLITISASEDQSTLRFDVEDTGCGINPEDRERIFEPYEKGDVHARGAGLGLAIASKIAAGMDGAVTLVASEAGRGSHFRVEIRNPGFACSPDARNPTDLGLTSLPRKFRIVDVDCQITKKFARHLRRRGFIECGPSPDALSLISLIKTEQCQNALPSLDKNRTTICLVPSGAQLESLQPHSPTLLYLSSPFHADRYDDIIRQAETLLGLINYPGNYVTKKRPSVSLERVRITTELKALLVDDNAINLHIMRMYCEKRHIPYVMAMDGREAVEQYTLCASTDAPVNLVLMDLQMPNVDGVQATVEIRALERMARNKGVERGESIIFIVTGQDSAEDRANSAEAGADEFFVKPMSLKTLTWAIGRYFEELGD